MVTIAALAAAHRADAHPVSRTTTGLASWYGEPHHGQRTANGEIFDQEALTAAHLTLPFGTIVRVTNLQTGLSVDVRINDRGPVVPGRILDLSRAAARAVRGVGLGVFRARIDIVPREAPTGTAMTDASRGRGDTADAVPPERVRRAAISGDRAAPADRAHSAPRRSMTTPPAR